MNKYFVKIVRIKIISSDKKFLIFKIIVLILKFTLKYIFRNVFVIIKRLLRIFNNSFYYVFDKSL